MTKTDRKRGLAVLALAALLAVAMQASPAFAYIGPGAGLSLMGSVIGLFVAVFSALGIILSWPIRILLRRIRGIRANQTQDEDPGEAEST